MTEPSSRGAPRGTASQQAAAAVAAMPTRPGEIRCAICRQPFLCYGDLAAHYAQAHPGAVPPEEITLRVNGRTCTLIIEPQLTLKQALQLHLGLIGAKEMCDRGACGSCTVILDGKSVLSCSLLAADCQGKDIETVEGIAMLPQWQPLIDAYCKWDAMQCGYCTPGFLVTAKALLDRNPDPSEAEINEALSGNICICGTQPRHAQAIREAVQLMREGRGTTCRT